MPRAITGERLFELIGLIYEAALDEDGVQAMLAELTASFGVATICFTQHVASGSMLTFHSHAVPEPHGREYQEHYAAVCPRLAFARGIYGTPAILEPQYDYRLTTEEEMRRSEYYRWLETMDFRYFLAGALGDGQEVAGWVTIQRSPGQGHVSVDEIAGFGRLMPHLRRAERIAQHLRAARAATAAGADVLDRLGIATLLLDAAGRLIRTNREADELLAAADGLGLDRAGRVCAARPAVTAEVRRRVRLAAQAAQGGAVEPGGVARLPRPSGRADLLAFACPLRPSDRLPFGRATDPGVVALLVSDPARRERPPAEALGQAFTLTPAEARLAAALAAGATLRDYADGAGIAYETARWHLKRIYDKTETRRQSELIALLLRTGAALGGDRP